VSIRMRPLDLESGPPGRCRTTPGQQLRRAVIFQGSPKMEGYRGREDLILLGNSQVFCGSGFQYARTRFKSESQRDDRDPAKASRWSAPTASQRRYLGMWNRNGFPLIPLASKSAESVGDVKRRDNPKIGKRKIDYGAMHGYRTRRGVPVVRRDGRTGSGSKQDRWRHGGEPSRAGQSHSHTQAERSRSPKIDSTQHSDRKTRRGRSVRQDRVRVTYSGCERPSRPSDATQAQNKCTFDLRFSGAEAWFVAASE